MTLNTILHQVQLYEDFARSRAKKQVEEVVGEEIEMVEQPKEEKKPADSNQTHIFQVMLNFNFSFVAFC